MTTDRGRLSRRTHEVFLRALELESPDREAFVRRACGNEAELRQAVQRLLHAVPRTDRFLDVPVLPRTDPSAADADGSGASAPDLEVPGHVMAWAVCVSGAAQLIFLAAAAKRAGMALRLPRPRLTPGVRRLMAGRREEKSDEPHRHFRVIDRFTKHASPRGSVCRAARGAARQLGRSGAAPTCTRADFERSGQRQCVSPNTK